jgi:hypothetical protein
MCEDVSMLWLSLEFHFQLNSISIWEWVLDSLKFHIVQYFLKNFSVELNWVSEKLISINKLSVYQQWENQNKLNQMRKCVKVREMKSLQDWDECIELNVLCLSISNNKHLHHKLVFLSLVFVVHYLHIFHFFHFVVVILNFSFGLCLDKNFVTMKLFNQKIENKEKTKV